MPVSELMLLIVLAFRVRALTRLQVMRLLDLTAREQRRLIRRLDRRGLVRVRRALVAEPAPSDGPLASWAPGQPTPDLPRLSYRLRTRATAPTCFTDIVLITEFAARQLGGTRPDLSRLFQITHDVALGEAFIWLHFREPDRAERFVGEDLLRRRFRTAFGTYTPDAAVVTADGAIEEVIEGGGRYDTTRLITLQAAGVPWRLF